MKFSPPTFLLNFFRWFCHPDLHAPIEGDLLEIYEGRVTNMGKTKANLLLTRDILLLLRKDIIRPTDGTQRLNHYGMIKNYTKTSWRNLRRQRVYALINIGGLSISIACVLMILVFIQYEFSYDRFLPNYDEIYRVYKGPNGDEFLGKNQNAITPLQLASALREEYPEVKNATVFNWYSDLIGPDKDHLYYEAGLFADAHFFDVFEYTFVAGKKENALREPYSIVLTSSIAQKLFDTENVIGKEIINRDQVYLVTGVIEDPPKNASFPLDFVLNAENLQWYKAEINLEKWRSNGYNTFFTLHEGADAASLESKMPTLLEKYWIDIERYPLTFRIEAFKDLHLQSALNFDFEGKGNKKQLLLFSVIAILILILALVNYTNLAITRSMNRSKEVGLRKTIGAGRGQLVFQFLCESILITLIAFGFSLLILWTALPVFGNLLERPLSLTPDLLLNYAPFLLLFVVILGIVAGYYPAFFISRLEPIQAIRGKAAGLDKNQLRKGLTVAQFTISIAMIICTLTAWEQFSFIRNSELGYEKENIVTIRNRSRQVSENFEILRTEWLSNPSILAVTGSSNLPINLQRATVINDDEGGDPSDDLHIYEMRAGYDFLSLYDIELIVGRDFSREISDSLHLCIINETTANIMGWSPDEAIGKRFTEGDELGYREVIGVVKDFHMHSLHLEMEPMFIQRRDPRFFRQLSFKVNPQNLQETIQYLESTIAPYSDYPIEAKLLTDQYDALYKDDMNQSRLFDFFALMAILIAMIGLFGLATYTIHLRVKEVGVRKVLGASMAQIVTLVSKEFLLLVGIGFIIASPIAYYAIENWLDTYAYRISISWLLFVTAGGLALLIALLTVSTQSLKIALTDPAKVLKDE